MCVYVFVLTSLVRPFLATHFIYQTRDKRQKKNAEKNVPEEPQRNNQRKTEEKPKKTKENRRKRTINGNDDERKNPRDKDQSQLQERRAEPTSTCTLYKPPKKKINPEK